MLVQIQVMNNHGTLIRRFQCWYAVHVVSWPAHYVCWRSAQHFILWSSLFGLVSSHGGPIEQSESVPQSFASQKNHMWSCSTKEYKSTFSLYMAKLQSALKLRHWCNQLVIHCIMYNLLKDEFKAQLVQISAQINTGSMKKFLRHVYCIISASPYIRKLTARYLYPLYVIYLSKYIMEIFEDLSYIPICMLTEPQKLSYKDTVKLYTCSLEIDQSYSRIINESGHGSSGFCGATALINLWANVNLIGLTFWIHQSFFPFLVEERMGNPVLEEPTVWDDSQPWE